MILLEFKITLVLISFFLNSNLLYGATVKESLKAISTSTEFVEITPSNEVVIDLRYASTNNFTGQNLYYDFNKAWLHKVAAEKFKTASKALQESHPGYKLIIFDALRPRSVQQILWDHVKGSDREPYVANPQSGSMHNYGLAIDISLQDESGKALDMGTPFDDFTALSQPRHEEKFLKEGKLSSAQLNNRHLLKSIMEKGGFTQLPLEWWHYDALPKDEIKKNYQIIE